MRHAFVLLIACASVANATALRVSDIRVSREAKGRRVTCTVAWKNAWKNDRNYDAAWLFVKTRQENGLWHHVRLISAEAPDARAILPPDRNGVFVAPAAKTRGDVHYDVQLALDPDDDGPGEMRVYGLEMVYIPTGAFTLGDPDPKALDYASVYRSDAKGEPSGLFRIASEEPIDVGPREGALYYKVQHAEYEGDRQGPIPAAFPKGFAAFFAMKYEITQGQYAAFLNTLNTQSTFFRAIHGGRGYATSRGTIRLENNTYTAGAPDRPANWISWNDGLAFADWAALRPMTEFEFTKAARGPAAPVAHEFPWGTATADRLRRVMGPDDDLVTTDDADESLLSDATRDVLGASHYWVMDLAGSVWERVITFGHPRGRNFRGSHGDGTLSVYGDATNADWPSGDQEAGGYGYRGGGYYERGMQPRDFNPYSPIAWRRYGSWGGGPRAIAYGFRAVRTAPE